MDKKTLANIAAFALCFLLWIKFGVEGIWLNFAIGFAFVVMVILFTMSLQFFFFDYYEKKFLPGFKRITGREFPLETIPYEQRLKIRGGIPPGGSSDLPNFLGLDSNEKILFQKRLDLLTSKRKNGKIIVRNYLAITSAKMIIIDTRSDKKDVIPLSDIIAIEGKMKYFFMYKAMRPFLRIKSTQKDVYEIGLPTFKRNMPELNEIAATLKRYNPQVEITFNDLIGHDPLYSATDKRLLYLLPFVLLLLALAIWQLFQYIQIHGLNEVKF
jgi:hypothetical protein